MTQDLMMSIRVDVDLWKRFEHAAEMSRQIPDDIIKTLMSEYADRHSPDIGRTVGEIETDDEAGLQIDLEEFLLVPAGTDR